MFNKKCAYCGCELKTTAGVHMHVDHVKPVVRNVFAKNIMISSVNHTEDNLFPSCPRCNNYKSTMSIETFRKEVMETLRKLEKYTLYNNAIRFGIIETKQWDGQFYFEKCFKPDVHSRYYICTHRFQDNVCNWKGIRRCLICDELESVK